MKIHKVGKWGIWFDWDGDEVCWIWPFRRENKYAIYFSISFGRYFKSLKELDNYWKAYFKALEKSDNG